MNLNYEEVKKILRQSFETILGMAEERELTFDEIKGYFAEILYDITVYGKEEEKVTQVEKNIVAPQVLYGPPRVVDLPEKKDIPTYQEVVDQKKEVVDIKTPQVLYGPPQVTDLPKKENIPTYQEVVDQKKDVVDIKTPQVLYGPPQVTDLPKKENIPTYDEIADQGKEVVTPIELPDIQVLYGPPPASKYSTYEVDGAPKVSELDGMLEDKNEFSMDHGDEYIPGTNIWKPRERGIYESDDDYVAYLNAYYSLYFPDQVEEKGGSKKGI